MSQIREQYDSRNKVKEAVYKVVSDQMSIDVNKLKEETHYVNDLNADSLDNVDMVMALEDLFDISVPDEEAAKLSTLTLTVDYIWDRIKK